MVQDGDPLLRLLSLFLPGGDCTVRCVQAAQAAVDCMSLGADGGLVDCVSDDQQRCAFGMRVLRLCDGSFGSSDAGGS